MTMATEVTIHGTGSGTCSLTGRTGDGLTVTFKDGTVSEAFLSWKGFQQILALKAGKNGKPAAAARGAAETGGGAAGKTAAEPAGAPSPPEGAPVQRGAATNPPAAGGTPPGGGK
jgi:hypothetical protein